MLKDFPSLNSLKSKTVSYLASFLHVSLTQNCYPVIFTEIAKLQELTKASLDRQWKNCLSHDWIDKARGFPLHEFYVELKWSRQGRTPTGNTQKIMKNIYEILDVAGAKAMNILIEGKFV